MGLVLRDGNRLWIAGAVVTLSLASCATTSTPRLRGDTSSVVSLAKDAARRHDVDPSLVLGVIAVESGFNPRARSHVGARGLMQLMPKTAASLGRRLHWRDPDPDDPAFNVEAGTYYLAYLLRLFEGDEALALAAYNTGPARVRRWWRAGRALPAYSRRYVAAVRRARARFVRGARVPAISRPEHDREGLRRLLRQKLYGDRPDETLEGKVSGAGGHETVGSARAYASTPGVVERDPRTVIR